MTKKREIYKCEICGNIVEILHEGVGTLVCCGKSMSLMKEKNKEEGKEKHIPIISENEKGINVKIGSIEHPMTKEHYIEWVEISTENGESKKFLSPNEKPEVNFPVKNKNIKTREYCNIHGLWKNDEKKK